MVVGGEEDVRGMEGETEVNKSEFGMRFHGPHPGLLDHVDRLPQLAVPYWSHSHASFHFLGFNLFFSPGPAKANLLAASKKSAFLHIICVQ